MSNTSEDIIKVLLPIVRAIHDSTKAVLSAWAPTEPASPIPGGPVVEQEKVVCSVCNAEWWAVRGAQVWALTCPECGAQATMLVE